MTSARSLDQFFTKPAVALDCWGILQEALSPSLKNGFFVEPSAGACAFLQLMPKGRRAGFDLAPQQGAEQPCLSEVVQADFLGLDLSTLKRKAGALPVVVAGNPPFGKNSSLALRFLNRCAEFASVIGFVLPRTFSKVSTLNKVHPSLHLVKEVVLPAEAFEFEGQSYDVPCVFQVWERRNVPRKQLTVKSDHADFSFGAREDATFAMRRVGALAGKVISRNDPKFATYAEASHYFIQARSPEVEAVMRSLDFDTVKHRTAGNPSVSKHELIELYEEAVAKKKRQRRRS